MSFNRLAGMLMRYSRAFIYAIGGIVAIAVFFLAPAAVSAAPTIEVTGNSKTKTPYVEKLTRICLNTFDTSRIQAGLVSPEVVLQAQELHLKQCLINNGLFSEIEIRGFSEDKIELFVRDKWSFIALPSYRSWEQEDSVFWGILMFDFNTRGHGELAGLIYDHQEQGKLDSFSFLYEIPYVDRDGKFGFSFAISDRNRNYYSVDDSGWNYRVLEEFQFFWLRLKQRLTPKFSLTYGYTPSNWRYRDTSCGAGGCKGGATTAVPNPVQNVHGVTLGAGWEDSNRRYYYDDGEYFAATLFHQVTNSAKVAETALIINARGGVPTRKQEVFQWHVDVGWRSDVEPYNSWRIGGEVGARGLPPDSIWGQGFATAAFDYQFPMAQGTYGFWNIGPFMDLGYIGNVQHSDNKDFGYVNYGIASYVHLRQVNVPALGIFYGFSDRFSDGQLGFFAGFQF